MVHHRRITQQNDRALSLFNNSSLLCCMARVLLLQCFRLPVINREPILRTSSTFFQVACFMFNRARNLMVEAPRPIKYRWSGLTALLHFHGGPGNLYNAIGVTVQQLEIFAHHFLGTLPLALGNHKGRISPVDAMAVTWYRLATSSSISLLERALGMPQPKISAILTKVTRHLSAKFFPMLSRPAWLHNRRFVYNARIQHAGCRLAPIIGFIDGTRIEICRDQDFQDRYYSGYSKNHCLVYISICFPDGTACIRGPTNGCHNDLGALDILGLNDEGIRNEITTDAFVLGGDGIFQSREQIETATDPTLSADVRHQFVKCRQSVEWSFQYIYSLFPFLRKWYTLRMRRGTAADKYNAACVLSQAMNTIKPNQISQYFGLLPPNLHEIFPL